MDRSRSRMSGSSLTDHLVLQNLELEMELLKKKRDLLERRMDPHGRETQYDHDVFDRSYDQQPYHVQPQYNYNRDFPSKQRSKNQGKQFGKRQHEISPWVNDIIIPKKRQSTYDRNTSFSNEPMSLMAIDTGAPNRRSNIKKFIPPQPARKSFKPTKVVKQKPATLNKLNSRPLPERKALVAEASKLAKTHEPTKDDERMILHPDKVPTQQMTGRLELALGRIIKEMKAEYGNTDKIGRLFAEPHPSRNLKQAVRERLKNVMLGKSVSNCVKIYDTYRESYSLYSDAEIIEKVAKESKFPVKPAITFRPSDNPKSYIRFNFKKFLIKKMTEMFEELQNVYKNKTEEEMLASNAFSDIHILKKTYKKSGKGTSGDPEKEDSSENPGKEESSENPGKEESSENPGKEESSENPGKETSSENPGKEDTSEIQGKDDSTENPEKENANEKDEGDRGDEKTAQTDKYYFKKSDEEKLQCCNAIIHKMFNDTVPALLTDYIPKILAMMDDDQAFNLLKSSLLAKADKLVFKPKKEVSSVVKEVKVPRTPWNYSVKLISKPNLPKRDVMQPFLDKFKPISIKKPKSNSRLLLIGFDVKENYDNILAANGTVLEEKYTLVILAAQSRGMKDATTNDTSTNANQSADNDELQIIDNSKEILNVDLEDQITDLLSSIKQAEGVGTETEKVNTNEMDDDNNKTGEDVKVMEVTENTLDDGNSQTDIDLTSAENEDGNVTEDQKAAEEVFLVENTKRDFQPNEESDVVQLIEDDGQTDTAVNIADESIDDATEENVNETGDIAKNEQTENLKNDSNKQSPVRSSPRRSNAVSNKIQTRRTSKLAQNNN